MGTYAGEHMPRVHEDEGCDEPHDIGRAEGHDDRKERSVLEQHANCEFLFFDRALN